MDAKIYKFIPVKLAFPRGTLLFGETLLLAQLLIVQGNPLIRPALLFGTREYYDAGHRVKKFKRGIQYISSTKLLARDRAVS